MTRDELNAPGGQILDPRIAVHKELGPGHDTGKYYEVDILIENEIVFEAKAVEDMHPVFEAQMISYLKLTDRRPGYLVNFNVVRLKDGFRRFVNNF